MVYSSIYKVSNVCEFGKLKKFDRISTGFIGCGPAKTCLCTKEKISKNVSVAKTQYSDLKKDEINQKRSNTMLEKYGCEFNSQRDDIKHIWEKPKISIESFDKLTNYEWLNNEYNIKNRNLIDIASELKVYYSTVAEYCKKFNFKIRQTTNYSQCEKEICDFLDNLEITYKRHDWEILKNKEIDILIPEKKIGIEVNGLYWHSYNPSTLNSEDRLKHYSKTEEAKLKNIDLLHITDYEWKYKNNIIKNIIKSKLGMNDKIYARKCVIKEVNKNEEKIFLNNYHLQGYIFSEKCYGLFNNNELMMIMSFSKSRFNKNAEYEILRICSKENITVVGGLSKLITHIKIILNNKKIITYCDYSKSSGNSYIKSGFKMIGKSNPGYFWTDGNIVISRYKTQKNQLKKWLSNYCESLSESENMFKNKFKRYWDCGNLIFLI
jgi:hypothetical protein